MSDGNYKRSTSDLGPNNIATSAIVASGIEAAEVINDTGITIPAYKVVMVSGDYSELDIPKVSIISSTSDTPVGIIVVAVPNGQRGLAIRRGRELCVGFDTSTSSIGSMVYYNPGSGLLSLSNSGAIAVGQVLTLSINGVVYFNFGGNSGGSGGGPTGPTGPGNFTGYTGYTGRTGYTGYTGPNITGYTGYTGATPSLAGLVPYSGANSNTDLGTYDLKTLGSLIAGIEQIEVRNATGSSITAIKVVKVSGDYATSAIPLVTAITALTDRPIGVIMTTLTTATTGIAVKRGRQVCTGFNTSAAAIGDKVYSDATGALTLTATLLEVGQVLSLATDGVVYFNIGGAGSSGSTIAPALTGKYVLPSSYPLTTTPTKFMYLTIPSSGLYLISSEYNAIGNGGSDSYMHFYLAKNGVVISGTRQEPYTAGVGSQWPITINITETFNAGDEIQVYAYLDSPRGGFVYIDSTRSAFIQYTQLQSNVPVVTTVTKEYACIKMSNYQDNVAAGGTLAFDTLINGNMTFDGANNKVLCKANIKYRMSASAPFKYTNASDLAGWGFYNLNTSTMLDGEGFATPSTYATNAFSNGNPEVIFTPTVDTWVCIKTSSDSSVVARVYTPNRFSSWTIESIEANIPVVATLGQDAWVGPLQDLIIASRDKTPVNSTAKVKFTKDSSGQWFAELWLADQWASATLTGQNWYTTGVSFKDDPSGVGLYWSLSGGVPNGVGPMYYALAYPNNLSAGRIAVYHASGATTGIFVQGKVPLNSKPVGYSIPDNV